MLHGLPRGETSMSKKLAIGIVVALAGIAGVVIAQQSYPNVEDPTVVMENDHVIVQKFRTSVDAWTGKHTHEGNQLVVILEDTTVVYNVDGEETEEARKAGDVYWIDEVEHDHMGKTDGEVILITIK